MSHNLTESATFDANVTVPDDGDARNAASVNTAFQALTNRTKYLNNYKWRGSYDSTSCSASADVNVDVTAGDVFRIPNTLTGNRIYTLTSTGTIPAGSIKWFFRALGGGVSAHTVQINGTGVAITMAASQQGWAGFLWDGSGWHIIAFAEAGVTAITAVTNP